MSYALVYNPERRCLQVIRLLSQAFGSLGDVVAWYMTAKLIQCIMLKLFVIVVFVYVDDFCWVIPEGAESDSDYAACVMSAFKRSLQAYLAWSLMRKKSMWRRHVITWNSDFSGSGGSHQRRDSTRRKRRLGPMICQEHLSDDCFPPALASNFCGRVSLLNSTVFNRLGRALIRPLI